LWGFGVEMMHFGALQLDVSQNISPEIFTQIFLGGLTPKPSLWLRAWLCDDTQTKHSTAG